MGLVLVVPPHDVAYLFSIWTLQVGTRDFCRETIIISDTQI